MPTNDFDATEPVLIALRRIVRAIDIHSRQLASKVKLTMPQLVALKEIVRNGEMPIGCLAKRINLSNATVTGIADRLESRGLIERRRSETDRRQVLVRLTDDGKVTVKNLPPLLQERFINAFTRLKGWEQAQLLASLERIAAMMDAEEIEASPVLTTMPIDESVPAMPEMESDKKEKTKRKGK